MPTHVPDHNSGSNIRLRVLLGILILIILALIVFIPTQYTIRNVYEQSLSHKLEPITELYFTDPDLIPKTYTPGQIIELPFTVHNLENKNMEYYFQITVNDRVIASEPRSADVQNGVVYKATPKILILPEQSGDIELSISLKNMPQSIHVRLQRSDQ